MTISIERTDVLHLDDAGRKGLVTTFTLAAFAALMVLRDPLYLTDPRLWAEEAKVVLAYTQNVGLLDGLTAPHMGYFSLVNNVASVLAAWTVPLAFAAHVTTWLSFALQLLTVAVILRSPGPFAGPFHARVLIALGLVVFCTDESWLNSLNMQYWFAAATPFVLTAWRIDRWQVAFMALALTTGVTSLFFAPFFVLRLWRDRTPELAVIVAVAMAAAGVQAVEILGLKALAGQTRFRPSDLGNIRWAVLETVVYPVFRPVLPGLGRASGWIGLGLFLGVLAVAAVRLRGRRFLLLWLAAPVGLYAVLAILSSLTMSGGVRYALPLSVVFLALIVKIAHTLPPRLVLAVPAVFLLLQSGRFLATEYGYDRTVPSWRAEVEALRPGVDTWIRIQPVGWTVAITWPPDAEAVGHGDPVLTKDRGGLQDDVDVRAAISSGRKAL